MAERQCPLEPPPLKTIGRKTTRWSGIWHLPARNPENPDVLEETRRYAREINRRDLERGAGPN